MIQTRSIRRAGMLFSSVLVTVFLTTGFVTAFAAGEDPVLIIIKHSDQEWVSPEKVTVKLVTPVIWVNKNPEPITIKFTDKIGIACKAPINFYGDLLGNYETSAIAQGATASICFIRPGTYNYEVHRLVGGDNPHEEVISGSVVAVK